MEKEEFIALGISEELAEKAATESKKELSNYVSKDKLEETESTRKELEKQIKDRDKQLKELKEKAGDNEELKTQLEQMEAVNKQVKEEYEEKIRDMKKDAAILKELSDFKYPELMTNKIDRSKVLIAEDNTIAGLKEQVEYLKNNYKELLKVQNEEGTTGGKRTEYKPVGGETHKEGYGAQMATQKNEAEKSANTGLWSAAE